MKPSDKEEEYFARQQFEKKRKQAEAQELKLKDEEKKTLQKLHFMHCPKCGMDLIEIPYKDLKIDKCSSCAGIWLDAGELEAIAELEKNAIDKIFSVFKK